MRFVKRSPILILPILILTVLVASIDAQVACTAARLANNQKAPDIFIEIYMPEFGSAGSKTGDITLFRTPTGNFVIRTISYPDGDTTWQSAVSPSTAADYVASQCPPGTLSGIRAQRPHATLSAAPRSSSSTPKSTTSPAFGQDSQSSVSVDVNGDGFPDIVAVNEISTVTIQLVDGNNNPISASSYPAGKNPDWVVAGDFNGDGKIDLAISDNGDGTSTGGVSILLGNGDGTFQPAVFSPSGNGPLGLQVADFNGDGKLDVALSDFNNGNVTVMLGNGDGTLSSPANFPVDAHPVELLMADFNNDGKPDLVTFNFYTTTLSVLLGKGDGTFQPEISVPSQTTSGDLAFADLNGDGNLDLAVSDLYSDSLLILFGNGDGTFQAPSRYYLGNEPGNLAILPFEDGTAAFFSMDSLTGDLNAVFSQPDGTVGSPPIFLVGSRPTGVAAVDVNGDKQPDLLITDGSTGDLYVLLNQGNGQFAAPTGYTLTTPVALAVGDLNGDGNPDAVIADSGSSGIAVLLGNANGTFNVPQLYASGSAPVNLVLADFNGDGKLDVAAASPGGVIVLLGKGDGTFASQTTVSTGALPPAQIASADFNGDGITDLVTANLDPSTFQGAGTVTLLLGNGDGTFSTPTSLTFGPSGSSPFFVLAGDFNNDKHTDLLVLYDPSSAALLLGHGDGTFQAPVVISQDGSLYLAAALDLNGDGNLDLILGNCCGLSNANYLLGNGDGTFQAEVAIAAGPQPAAIAVADLNNDGAPDVVFAGFTESYISGSFQSGTFVTLYNLFPAFSSLANVSAADFATGPLAPESIVAAFGSDLANQTQSATTIPLQTSLGGTTVLVTDATGNFAYAPLFFVSPLQVNYEIPAGLASGTGEVQILSGDGTVSSQWIDIEPLSPGLFTLNSSGLAAAYAVRTSNGAQIVEQVYTVTAGVIAAAPIDLGSGSDVTTLVLYGTGLRSAAASQVSVTFNGVPGVVQFSGAQPELEGLDQVNVVIPVNSAVQGDVAVDVTVGNILANEVHVTVQ